MEATRAADPAAWARRATAGAAVARRVTRGACSSRGCRSARWRSGSGGDREGRGSARTRERWIAPSFAGLYGTGPAMSTRPRVAAIELAPGILLASKVRLVRRLGHGGMGVVWEAKLADTGQRVAVKLLKETGDDPEAHRRLLREARAASAVRHPNVVSILDVLELEDGSPAIVMELLEG